MTDPGGDTAPVGDAPAPPAGSTAASAPPDPTAHATAALATADRPDIAATAPAAVPTGPAAPAARPGASSSGPTLGSTAEWPVKAADAIDLVVGTVNDKAVRPAVVAARAIVFGLLIAVMAMVIVVLGSVGILRLLDVYVFPGRVWASYAVLGLLFSIVGIIAWSRRRAPQTSGPA